MIRPTRAEVSLGAIGHNVETLAALVAPSLLMAVVKSDAYGHGMLPVAKAAVGAGADWLGVSTVEEALELRGEGLTAPILLLSEPPVTAVDTVVEQQLTPAVYTPDAVDALRAAAGRNGARVDVHLKVDTGLARVGVPAGEAVELAKVIVADPGLSLGAVWTHLAVADQPDHVFTEQQLATLSEVIADLADAGITPELIHAANSAGAIAHPASRLGLVRCGIAVYGLPPSERVGPDVGLVPALQLVSEVSFCKRVPAGTGVSYGLEYTCESETTLATVPIGYADGVPRRLPECGGQALVRGRRVPIAGVVTMSQVVLDCRDVPVAPGDEVVLIGKQGDEEITATEWADLTGTINYEIVTGIGSGVPRVHR